MRARFFRISVALLGLVTAAGCTCRCLTPQPLVRETFESTIDKIDEAFWLCWRPENDFEVTPDQARTGKQSLRLTVRKLPLFAHQELPPTKALDAKSCMASVSEQEARQYLNDESERAEIWEQKKASPPFGRDIYYGFSMRVDRSSAPAADFNRMVVGQWKIRRKAPLPEGSPPLDSPFLSLRMTGGFFHIMLGVEADPKTDAELSPDDCKVLLAFVEETPPNMNGGPLPLTYETQCESRLNYALNQGQPMPIGTPKIDRFHYLPNPFGMDGKGAWLDLIFLIRGGANGVVEVWANGKLTARAAGWIGYWTVDKVGDDQQYFKFGPYRDPAGYDTVIYLDNLARGASKDEVDPSKY